MNEYRKIGFRAYNGHDDSEEDRKIKRQSEMQNAISNFISNNYVPLGSTSQKCYKTTTELIYDLVNIIPVLPSELAKQLTDAGYLVEYIAGQPFWVLYERI